MSKAEEIAAAINKKLGEELIVMGSRLRDEAPVSWLSTGSLSLDVMLGGGFVRSQWNEIVGLESSGKTAAMLKCIACNQLLDPNFTTLWIAAEDLDPVWCELLGVDMGRVLVGTTNVMEEAYQICIEFVDAQAGDLLVIDSYPALSPTVELEKLMEESTIGLGALLTNRFMRKSIKSLKRFGTDRQCTCVMINQWRHRIGVVRGDPRTTPGGLGKNYTYWTRTELSRIDWITKSKERIGITAKARTFKNKSAPVQREAELDFYFDDGGPVPAGHFDTIKESTNVALAFEVIERHGRYYDFRGERIADGRDALYDLMYEQPELPEKIYADVMAKMRGEEPPEPPRRGVKRRRQD